MMLYHSQTRRQKMSLSIRCYMIQRSPTDLYIYELHVAEFIITKVSVVFYHTIFFFATTHFFAIKESLNIKIFHSFIEGTSGVTGVKTLSYCFLDLRKKLNFPLNMLVHTSLAFSICFCSMWEEIL